MCGIHGFAWRDPGNDMDRMLSAAAHRGPDGGGSWGDDAVTLGHNLLALTADPAASLQPLARHGLVLTYNGELYNSAKLASYCSLPDTPACDTAVLAAGLAARGVDFLRRADGMFALAYYTPATRELVLARDTNGARPLYYGRLNGRLAFSSEVRSLLALGFDRRVSRDGFRHLYHAGLVAGPLTAFDGIYKLVPGQVIRFNLATGDQTSINLMPVPAPYEGPAAVLPDLVRERVRESVRRVAACRRPVGLFLSGGMDSSAVLHEAAGLGFTPLTFTTRFGLPNRKARNNDDANVARHLAKVYATKHREVVVDEARWAADFEAAVVALEEPRQGKSHPAYLATNRTAARDGAVVVLTGDGGDELLLGYKHQLTHPFEARLAALRLGQRELPDRSLALPAGEQADYLRGWLPAAGLTGDAVNDFMYAEALHTLAEDFLVRSDKLGMAFGMEARYPLTAGPLRDFVRGVPGRLKVAPKGAPAVWDLRNKWLLRRAYAGRLPDPVVKKAKTGWRAPTDGWVVGIKSEPAPDRGPVRDYLRSVLADRTVRDLFGITDADVENRYLNNRDFGLVPRADGKPGPPPGMAAQKELFTVAAFAVWMKAFGMRLW